MLRQPIERVEYLLRLEGLLPKGRREQVKGTTTALLEEVFVLNEQLDAIRAAREDATCNQE